MKIDLPALNSITSSNIDYDGTYPKTYAGYSIWPGPMSVDNLLTYIAVCFYIEDV